MPIGKKGFQKGNQEWKNKRNFKHSEETKRKMSNDQKGQHRSPETEFKKGQNCGENNPRWKGGKLISSQGYLFILKHNHPFANRHGYVPNSRLVMEKYLGRYLKHEEVVHHINGIKTDDQIKNLKLCPNNSEHRKCHKKKG